MKMNAKKTAVLMLLILQGISHGVSVFSQTDAYIKLRDERKKHLRVSAISYPGDSNWRDVYNSIYGHGGVVENPWVAFRVYIDNRQSVDLYVKQTPRLELEQTGFYSTPEQIADGYGCDVLKVGETVSAGAFRGWQDGTPVSPDTVACRGQRVVGDDTLEVFDEGWIFNGHPIEMTQRFSVNPENRVLDVEVTLDGWQPGDLFATGVQKLESDCDGFIAKGGLAASWGSNAPDGKHPEIVETVGLGIAVDPANVVELKETTTDRLIIVRPDAQGKIRYRIYACSDREKDGFNDAASWMDYVRKEGKKVRR